MNSHVWKDEVFGQWEWDEELKEWRTNVEWTAEITIEVTFDPEGMNEMEGFRIVHELWRKIKENWRDLENQVADHLLDLHNTTWNEGEPIQKDAFIRRMTIQAIRFYCDGTAEIYFDDGDLLWGHIIVVSVNRDGRVEDANIAG